MIDEILDRVASPEFEAEVVASTPRALRDLLRRKREVSDLRQVHGWTLTNELLRQFVGRLLQKGAGCERFPYQIALAAIAVVLEPRWDRFADEYLIDLARVRDKGFSIASGVARECLKRRAQCTRTERRVISANGEQEFTGNWEILPYGRAPLGDETVSNTFEVH